LSGTGKRCPKSSSRARLSTFPTTAKLCPECGRILIKYGVGHGMNFTLDQCGHCLGIWFDKNEWVSLKQRNLHDEVHKVFTASWQTQARKEERKRNLERIYLNRFGSDQPPVF
jgi:Zn-finger nucleic acid-binding protein